MNIELTDEEIDNIINIIVNELISTGLEREFSSSFEVCYIIDEKGCIVGFNYSLFEKILEVLKQEKWQKMVMKAKKLDKEKNLEFLEKELINHFKNLFGIVCQECGNCCINLSEILRHVKKENLIPQPKYPALFEDKNSDMGQRKKTI